VIDGTKILRVTVNLSGILSLALTAATNERVNSHYMYFPWLGFSDLLSTYYSLNQVGVGVSVQISDQI